jgi:hypothetical protein
MSVQPSQFSDIMAWIKSNEIVLGLLLSAIVITMPEKLPGLREFPGWMWEWIRDALKTFMNFRHSGAPVSDVMHSQQQAIEQQPKVVAAEQQKKAMEVVAAMPVPAPVEQPKPQLLNE